MAEQRIASRRIAKRIEWLEAGMPERVRMTDAQKKAVIALVEDGATLVEIETLEGMPSARTIHREKHSDPAFGAALDEAIVMRASIILDEAHHNIREAMDTNDPDTVRNAAAYVQAAREYSERTAPKEYGALLKLAGHDGGQLSVVTIDYSKAIDAGKLIESTDSHAREEASLLEAKEEGAHSR